MQISTVYVNEFDLARLGFVVENVPELRSGASMRYQEATAPGMAGNLLLSALPQMGSRPITVRGVLRASSAAALLAAHDELQERLQAGDIEVRVVDAMDRFLVCRYRDRSITPIDPQFLNTTHRCDFVLEAVDPLWYDRDPVPLAAPTGGLIRCLLGTAPIWPVIHLMGAATNPVITLKNAAGDTVGTMTLTVTLAAGDYLVIDCGAGTITKYVSGAATDGLSQLTAGDFPVISPENGDAVAGALPTLSVSAGSLAVFYRRGYA